MAMTIGKKIGWGFTVVLGLLVLISIISLLGINGIVSNAKDVIYGNKLRGEIVQREVDHLNWVSKVSQLLNDENVTTLDVQTDPEKCKFGQWFHSKDKKDAEQRIPALRSLFADVEKPHQSLHHSAIEIKKVFKQADPSLPKYLTDLEVAHLDWINKVYEVFAENLPELQGLQTNPKLCGFGKWLYGEGGQKTAASDPKMGSLINEIKEPHKRLHESAISIQKALAEKDRKKAKEIFEEETLPALKKTRALLKEMQSRAVEMLAGMRAAAKIYEKETAPALASVQKILGDINETTEENIMTDEQMLHQATMTRWSVGFIAFFAVIGGIVLVVIIGRGIISAISRIVTGLTASSDQLAAASEQVSQSSQSMAEGASEQASSLEEITSSLEEMSSMTQQNAENARQASTMSSEANKAAENGTNVMRDMSVAIAKIKSSSDETAKILKTIDEIAFQTNLLALNAAVEAARAGEAGKGFAVVAEEVRNLAQRSAEAAKSTSALIEESQSNSDNGVKVAQQVDEIFRQIVESSKKANNLVQEVNAASNEQAHGINQINQGVSQLDQVTQANAANSEESASASEELSAQAVELNDMVAVLAEMAGVQQKRTSRKAWDAPVRRKPVAASIPSHAKSYTSKSKQNKAQGSAKKIETAQHENIIPLDDEDFKDF